MPWYHYQDQHNEEEFVTLAETCGIKAIIDKYRELGLVFCYYEGSGFWDTGYNREPDFISQPALKEGIVYIRSDGLERLGLSKEEGFTVQTLHELGHYEAFRQRLDYRNEEVAWDMAENIARAVYGGVLPVWWSRVRADVRAKDQKFWESFEKRLREEGDYSA
jgi:hypothetical protein